MKKTAIFGLFLALLLPSFLLAEEEQGEKSLFRIGIIGTTTSHVPAAIDVFNNPDREGIFKNFEITAAFAGGIPDNPSSWDRREKYAQYAAEHGVKIYPTIEEMLAHVDGVCLASVDGRIHLEQAKPVIAAGKPLFIDKPMAGSLADVVEIFRLADEAKVPVFSASSLRFTEGFQAIRKHGETEPILGADAVSPCSLNPKHPDLFWYGIHGVETLFTVMGKGCVSVSRTHTDDYDLAVGVWEDGRIGTFRGVRSAYFYECNAYDKKGRIESGKYNGYGTLFTEICQFFETGVAPVDPEETINMFVFMVASDESARLNGQSVSLAETLEKAKNEKQTTLTIQMEANQTETVLVSGETIAIDQISDKIDALAEGGTVVRVILDNRAGADFSVVEKILPEIDRGYFANYLY